jgi:predicted nucleic acid-binding protein
VTTVLWPVMVFVDTSGLYAVFDRDDRNHAVAAYWWRSLLDSDVRLVTHNYVVLELTALLRGRLGMDAVRDLTVEVLPVLTVQWVSETIHATRTPNDAVRAPRGGMRVAPTESAPRNEVRSCL